MKQCKKCGRTKPISHFKVHATNKDGREGACRDCNRRKPDAVVEGYFDVDAYAKEELFQPPYNRAEGDWFNRSRSGVRVYQFPKIRGRVA